MIVRLFVVLCILATASSAFAEATVVVLGVRSVEGDDELANDLTEQLRGAAKAVEGWTVSSAAVSMAQMSLAHGCDELDATCLSDIAKGLQVQRIIYGTLRRNSANNDYDFAFSMSLYDAETGQIARTVEDTIPRSETSFEALASRADRLIARLSSDKAGGMIVVQANVPDADVTINGQAVGTTREGILQVPGLRPGKYRVEIAKAGYSSTVTTVSVTEGSETAINAALSQAAATTAAQPTAEQQAAGGGGGHHLQWLGWTLIGVSAASIGGMVASMLVIKGVNDDPLYSRYKSEVFEGNQKAADMNPPGKTYSDSCAAATDAGLPFGLDDSDFNEVVDMCNRAETFQVLQWVFLGSAVATGVGGTILLLTAADEWDEAAAPRRKTFAFSPRFGVDSGHVTATLRF